METELACHPERSEAESRDPVSIARLPRGSSTSLGMTAFRYRVRGAGVGDGRRCVFVVFFTVIVSGGFV
jgi:hypothetical protein